MKILRACIDSSDNTDLVYQYVKPREERGIIAVKGSATPGRGIVSNRPSKQKYSVNLYIVGVTAAKDLIYHRLRNLEPGTGGFMHFNMSYDAEFFKELLGERIIRKKWNGRMVRTYEKLPNQRVEGLDATVYAVAALRLLNPNFQVLHRKREQLLEEKKTAVVEVPVEVEALSRFAEMTRTEVPQRRQKTVKRGGFLYDGWQRRY